MENALETQETFLLRGNTQTARRKKQQLYYTDYPMTEANVSQAVHVYDGHILKAAKERKDVNYY